MKDSNTKYSLKSDTFYITTESVTGGSDKIGFSLLTDSGFRITNIYWRFSDWGCYIHHCLPENYALKFSGAPPNGVEKTWEVTATPGYVRIKCDTLEVFHFVFSDTYNDDCTAEVKGKHQLK